jgi:hypothetical protein
MILPAQHEEDEERNEGQRQDQLGNRAGIPAHQVSPAAGLLHRDRVFVLLGLGQHSFGCFLDLLGLLPDLCP